MYKDTFVIFLLMIFVQIINIGIYGQNIIRVGPNELYKLPSEAVIDARDGDIVKIQGGMYKDDVVSWKQNNLTIQGINGRAHIKLIKEIAEGKAAWVIQGNYNCIKNIEFSGAKSLDRNGAGIRQEGKGLIVRNCYFHDNEDGILIAPNIDSDVIIEYSIFENNGYGDGYSHNLYVNKIRSLVFRYNYSHHAKIGHNLKTRAEQNYILYNCFMDGEDGTSSFCIDIPDGGIAYVIGNIIQQGANTQNNTMLAYGAEGLKNPSQELYIVHNTFVNDYNQDTTFIKINGDPEIKIMNNIFSGASKIKGTLILNRFTSPKFLLFNSKDFNKSFVIKLKAARDHFTKYFKHKFFKNLCLKYLVK